ncbi:MAG: DsbA family protein [Propionibacteriaceae bacterium]|nr:DsbA family protein [Propionibacteriaceae bacterium]
MENLADLFAATQAVLNPATSGADLAQIAQAQPSLWPQVASHPNVYPELLTWLDANGDAATKQAVAARRPAATMSGFPPPPPPPYYYQGVPQAAYQETDNGSFGWAVLGFFVPLAGLILWLVWRSTRPRDSKMARNGLITGVALGVLITAGALVWVFASIRNSPMPSHTYINPQPTLGQVTPPDGNSTDLSQAAWITVPSTSTLKSDAVRVDIHFDYQCPWCKLVEDTYAQGLGDLANSGDIVLNLHTRTFLDTGYPNQNSTRAAVAAACVDYVDGTKYYAYSSTIFVNQPSNEGDGFSDQQLTVDFPASVGLSGDALDKFQTCYSGRQTQDWVTNVESNNVGPVANNSAPPAFLYGSDSKIYGNAGNIYYDDPSKGTQVGVTAAPTMFVNGKPLSLGMLFNQADATSYPTPAIGTDAASILALLQQVAAG